MLRTSTYIISYFFLFAFHCFATPPSLFKVEPLVKTEFTFDEPPELDKWTKVRIKATSLNDWEFDTTQVRIDFLGSVRIDNGELPIWRNCGKKGSVYTAEFLIRPNMTGTSNLVILYYGVASICFVTLNKDGKEIFKGTWDDIDRVVGPRPKSNDWKNYFGYSKAQKDKYSNIITEATLPSEYIDHDKVTTWVYTRFGLMVIELSPLPAYGKENVIKFRLLDRERLHRDMPDSIFINSTSKENIINILSQSNWGKREDGDETMFIKYTINNSAEVSFELMMEIRPKHSGYDVLSKYNFSGLDNGLYTIVNGVRIKP